MGLEILKYDPNDYKLGEVLANKDGTVLKTDEKISAVLSLYFQWPNEASAFAYFDLPGRPSFRVCLEYDNEERVLSQLTLTLDQNLSREKIDKAFVRIEVFNGCYEFEAALLENFYDDKQYLIIEAPSELKSIKVRRSKRQTTTAELKCVLHQNGIKTDTTIKEFTLNGVVLYGNFKSFNETELHINNLVLNARYIRSIDENSAFQIDFTSEKQSCEYFDLYCLTAYPNLKKRSEVDFEKLYHLFEESGFFGNFSGKFDEEDRSAKAKQFWKNAVDAHHESTADYVIEKNNELLGSSSCANAYEGNNIEYWVFHQLCAKKDVNTIELTGDLYAWRAEYIWLRKSNITSVFWFRSESRWLERIYVKYAMQSPELGFVNPAQLFSYVHKSESLHRKNITLKPFGNEQRSFYFNGNTYGGLGPDYAHINRNMNLIYQPDGNWEEVYKAADSMTNSLDRDSSYFRVVMPVGAKEPDIDKTNWDFQNSVNRHAEIKKEGMLDFISCLNHSIAVTKRKLKSTG